MTKSSLQSEEKAEALMRAVVGAVAGKISGLVCAQVNPARAGDRDRQLYCAAGARSGQAGVRDQGSGTPVLDADICQAGLAVGKRADALYCERRYEARLLVAALRGSYRLTEL